MRKTIATPLESDAQQTVRKMLWRVGRTLQVVALSLVRLNTQASALPMQLFARCNRREVSPNQLALGAGPSPCGRTSLQKLCCHGAKTRCAAAQLCWHAARSSLLVSSRQLDVPVLYFWLRGGCAGSAEKPPWPWKRGSRLRLITWRQHALPSGRPR